MNESVSKQEEFQDPLENYEKKKFDDPLEQALVDEEVGNIRHEPFSLISPDTPVHVAVEKLVAIAPQGLGLVHGGVSMAEKQLRGLTVLW